ncbi:M1-specific T cell receptor alpha chain-like [Fundulus heteroclitus]|uniref:M1-specific T cell receptor alpha chain-like n=1 Tax=Fundulus heteroclitus TaxID=8078 RepID=UPI00165BEAEC|nr:M1-specific T cell receptor alpha chain-like [Fundulus heteroclitus]
MFWISQEISITRGEGTEKIHFGKGTKVRVEREEYSEPKVYELTDTKTEQKVCLATGFTRHNLLKDQDEFSGTEASQIVEDGKPTGIYNQVAVLDAGQACGNTTEKEPNEPCVASLEPDEMVNLASLTVFGLRVIFMKTVVFNVLMTLRLWISQ